MAERMLPFDQGRFVAEQSDDPVKIDLELVCTACDVLVCDIEHGDDLVVLVGVAVQHMGVCEPAKTPDPWSASVPDDPPYT